MEEAGPHIFADRKTLIVTMAEIRELMPMAECIAVQKKVFASFSEGNAINAPNTWLKPTGGTRWMKLLAGHIGGNGAEAMGMKVLARFPKNPPGMNIGSLVALFDPDNGFPMAIMDGVYFTGIRTGAGGGLSAQYRARPDSRRIALIGSGVQAKFSLMGTKQLMPGIEEGTVFSRSKERRAEFARTLQDQTQIRLQPVDTVEEAVDRADIVITATNSPTPVLFSKHVQAGQHIVAVGIKTEIEPAVLGNARVVADAKDIAREDGKFAVALRAGVVSDADLKADLGDVILGKVPGRSSRDEITLFDSSGLAVQDVACAQYVFEKAKKLGKGTWINLGLAEFP